MRRYTLPVASVQNVGASKTAVIDIPIGLRIHSVILQHGYSSGTNTAAAAATNVSEVRLIINGEVRRRLSGTQLRDLNLLHGTQYDFQGVPNTAPGVAMTLHLAEPWRKDVVGQNFGALPTQWVGGKFTSLQVEVDLSTATSPTLVAYVVADDVVPALGEGLKAPLMTEVQRLNVAAAGTELDIVTIDKRGVLLQVSLYQDSGGSNTSSRFTLQKNGVILQRATYSANFAALTGNDMAPTASGRTAGITDVVLDANDVQSAGEDLSDARELLLKVEAASAMSGTITAIVQRIVPAV